MSAAAPAEQSQIDSAYQAHRLRLAATVTAGVVSAWAALHKDRQATIDHVARLVATGQAHTVRLVDAYMTTKTLEATGKNLDVALDPSLYTTDTLRGVAAATVYGRSFGAYGAMLKDGAQSSQAVQAAQASVLKLAATDLQLAQTHAAQDWMQTAADQLPPGSDLRIVGYRRVLAGPGPHCELCTAASTRTYRVADLMPIHEHCTCGVQPLFGTDPVASIGTTVRVENDPEIGPRLMADHWSPVGPRLTQ